MLLHRLKEFFLELTDTADDVAWKRHVPFTREEAYEILTRDLPAGTHLYIHVTRSGHGEISLSHDQPKFSDKRTFELDKHLVHEGYMRIEDQGKGLGRTIMRNEIEFFAACGVKEFKIHASSEAGAYTWSRLGFSTKNPRLLMKHVNRRFKRIEPLLNDQERADIRAIIDTAGPDSAHEIASLRQDIGARVRAAFANATDRKLCAALRGIPALKKDLAKTDFLPLGRTLLTSDDYDGYLNLTDIKKMMEVGDYVGGWKIAPLGSLRR